MSRRSRPKPRIMLADADVTEMLALPQNAGVRIERQTRKNVERVRREDVFARLLGPAADREEAARRGAALQAVRRLEADLLERACRGDRADVRVRVDGAPWRGELATDRSIDAGDRVDRALGAVGIRDARLLSELLAPTLVVTDAVNGWRLTVQRLTGEKNEQAQAGAVRSAADNLRLAYEAIDRRPRR